MAETGGPGGGWPRGLIVDGPGGDDIRFRGALLLPLVSPVFLAVLWLPGRRVTSPVRPLITRPPVWKEGAAVGRPRGSRLPLLAAGLGSDRGLLLKPLGQLDQTVIRSLSVMVVVMMVMQAWGHFGHTVRLFQQPAPFGVGLCAAAIILIVMQAQLRFASSLFGAASGLLNRESSGWSRTGPPLWLQ